MDDVDVAQAVVERGLEASLKSRRRNPPWAQSALRCEDCDCEIPQARREAVPGCTRCVRCQETFEILNNWRN